MESPIRIVFFAGKHFYFLKNNVILFTLEIFKVGTR